MKKTYICPKMDVVEIKHQQTLLAGSFVRSLNNSGGDGSDALAREFDDDDIEF